MKHIPMIINFGAGILLTVLGIWAFVDPFWFFTGKYDIQMSTPQSKTELRTLSGFMATMGFLWIYFSLKSKQTFQVLKATLVLTLGFVVSRIIGLFWDGFEQTHTYHELIFEICALILILLVFWFRKKMKVQKKP